ncbi:MAG TPA: U32 family peptidase [Candidatus Syntrophoarchaeum butanivorans]|uniref:Collagenase-like protease n=1 Tax=Candidatus Syntropharchaeum butanivorans TaxID=1839936 RepID=A0A1F2P598_9EURY|nr:MAG: collagenase-like protease [Candidatus Syntrophoarchaeum butanivorans]HEC56391.1 U32 family peptidase [Candidatus Syntrophoarchaeum butanivorans]
MRWLSVAHPGHMEALKEIIRAGNGNIYEVYTGGSPDCIGTARSGLGRTTTEDIREQVEYAHSHGIRMNIVLNSSCLGGRHLTQDGHNLYRWYLNVLNDIGVDSVTVAEPFLVEMIAKEFPDIDITVSCIAFVNSPQKAMYYEELGAETIALDININKNFPVLQNIREAVSCKLKVLVNEGCILDCPFRYAHFNLLSHANGPEPRPPLKYEYYQQRCATMRVKHPELLISSGWIRPEDVKEYEAIGIDLFKISGRIQSVNWITNCVRAYSAREYHGNLLELLDSTRELRRLFYLPNDALEGAIEKWKVCDKNCYKCGYCKRLSKEILVYSGRRTPNEELKPLNEYLVVE